jgi:hypothetical protein
MSGLLAAVTLLLAVLLPLEEWTFESRASVSRLLVRREAKNFRLQPRCDLLCYPPMWWVRCFLKNAGYLLGGMPLSVSYFFEAVILYFGLPCLV